MLLNCGAGEDSWESLGLQGDPTSPSKRRQVLGVHWKDWCWNSNTLATSCKELTHWKRPWCWEGLGAGREGDDRGWDGWMASDSMHMSLGELQELVIDRESWHAAINGVAKSRTRLSDWVLWVSSSWYVPFGSLTSSSIQLEELTICSPYAEGMHCSPLSLASWGVILWSFVFPRV